jgi:MFS family permease
MTKNGHGGYRWIVLAILTISSFLVGISIYTLPPLYIEIKQDFELTNTAMGAIMSAITMASIFLALIGGIISDKVGSKWSYGLAVILVGLIGMLRGTAGNATALILYMAVIGVGVAVMMPNFPKSLGSWFEPSELGLANGIAISAYGLAAAVGMGLSSILSPALGGWRNTLFLLSFVVILAGIGWLLIFRDRRTSSGQEAGIHALMKSVKQVIRVRDVWILSAYSASLSFSLLAALSLLSLSLSERGNENAGALVSIFMIMSLVFNILGGFFSDRLGRRKPFLIAGPFILGVCLILTGIAKGPALITALVFGGIGAGATTPIAMLIPVELEEIGPPLAATAYGIIMSMGSVGGVLGPIICGWIMDSSDAHWPGFLTIGTITVLAGLWICSIRETGQSRTSGVPTSPA